MNSRVRMARTQTPGARRAAGLILMICRVPPHRADITSVAQIIDSETGAHDLTRMRKMNDALRSALGDLLMVVEASGSSTVDGRRPSALAALVKNARNLLNEAGGEGGPETRASFASGG
jgi:hypothetical protein